MAVNDPLDSPHRSRRQQQFQRQSAGIWQGVARPMISTEPTGLIPVTLVTGFLGSGKTTVLNHVLKQPAARDDHPNDGMTDAMPDQADASTSEIRKDAAAVIRARITEVL